MVLDAIWTVEIFVGIVCALVLYGLYKTKAEAGAALAFSLCYTIGAIGGAVSLELQHVLLCIIQHVDIYEGWPIFEGWTNDTKLIWKSIDIAFSTAANVSAVAAAVMLFRDPYVRVKAELWGAMGVGLVVAIIGASNSPPLMPFLEAADSIASGAAMVAVGIGLIVLSINKGKRSVLSDATCAIFVFNGFWQASVWPFRELFRTHLHLYEAYSVIAAMTTTVSAIAAAACFYLVLPPRPQKPAGGSATPPPAPLPFRHIGLPGDPVLH